MTEYVNKEELWNNRPEWRNPKQIDKKEYNKGWNDCLNEFLDIINAEPTIDIVRCKDCKHRNTFGIDAIDCRSTSDDWFCADMRRRD